ncbi:hypothetical protein ACIQYF_12260 [Pseudomonas sp. NPDC096917]
MIGAQVLSAHTLLIGWLLYVPAVLWTIWRMLCTYGRTGTAA